ncbi:hypothetical protein ABPG75_010699 [Micractinium tetrahymenae]
MSDHLQLSDRSWVDLFKAPEHLTAPAVVERLWRLCPPERGRIRRSGITLCSYTFSGHTLVGGPVPPELQPFLDWANSLPQYGGRFNEVLVNWYQDGRDWIGTHSDSIAQLLPDSPILSLSLGDTRTFRICPARRGGLAPHTPAAAAKGSRLPAVDNSSSSSGGAGGGSLKTSPDWRQDIELPHGTVLVMGGAMQTEFTHEVPQLPPSVVRQRLASGEGPGRRINVTLRQFAPEAAAREGAPPAKRQRAAAAG